MAGSAALRNLGARDGHLIMSAGRAQFSVRPRTRSAAVTI
jgi:hypothetical protein